MAIVKKPNLSISITEEQYLKLKLYATQQGKGHVEVARELLGMAIDEIYSPIDRPTIEVMEKRIQDLEEVIEKLTAIPSVRKAIGLDGSDPSPEET